MSRQINDVDKYKEIMSKLSPSEIIAAYLVMTGIIAGSTNRMRFFAGPSKTAEKNGPI